MTAFGSAGFSQMTPVDGPGICFVEYPTSGIITKAVADSIFHLLSDFFARYGYWVIFFGVMLENAGLPIPGETVLLFAGFLAYHGKIGLLPAILTAIAGATLGDSLGFWLGRYGGTAFVNRFLRRIAWVAKRYDGAQKLFVKYGPWAVFTARFITGLRVFSGILAGVLQMPYWRFLLFNFTGAVAWALTIGCVGFFFGSNWDRLVSLLTRLDRFTLAVVGVGGVVLFLVYLLRRKKTC
jgi:membrane-associated protein